MSSGAQKSGGVALLAFGTLGIVFGDIGTSPIYAFRETFHHADLEVTRATAFGAASVAFWALVIVICLKYLATVMRADNHGEGGILALTSLVIPPRVKRCQGWRPGWSRSECSAQRCSTETA